MRKFLTICVLAAIAYTSLIGGCNKKEEEKPDQHSDNAKQEQRAKPKDLAGTGFAPDNLDSLVNNQSPKNTTDNSASTSYRPQVATVPYDKTDVPYEKLVQMVKENNGLKVVLNEYEVNTASSPDKYGRKYGLGWTKSMSLTNDKRFNIDLACNDEDIQEKGEVIDKHIPVGFAYTTKMSGNIGGNPFQVRTVGESGRDTIWVKGGVRGYAWAKKMEGNIGDDLKITINTLEPAKYDGKDGKYPMGYGGIAKAEVTLSLVNK